MYGGNCLRGNCARGNYTGGIVRGVIVWRAIGMGGSCPGEWFWGAVSWRVIVRGGGNCPGRNCPRAIIVPSN